MTENRDVIFHLGVSLLLLDYLVCNFISQVSLSRNFSAFPLKSVVES